MGAKMTKAALALAAIVALAGGASAASNPAPQIKPLEFVSEYDPGTIVIKTGERKLYLVTGRATALEYRIAVGIPEEQWFGTSWVSKKRENPVWTPTPSMREKKPELPQSVGPGPKNPLGVRAINLGWGLYRIHGTNSPNSIGRAASGGCFRMRNADVLDLYERVHIGAQVVVLE